MLDTAKDIVRKLLTKLKLDLTQNLKYDRLTRDVIKRIVQEDSVCIDVGCHKGEILELILKQAPQSKHFAFEPIPELNQRLRERFGTSCRIYSCALSDHVGETTFQYVRNAPAYSGIKKREYAIDHPDIDQIKVEVNTLDNIIPANEKIRLIKIDVEGGEFGVMKGAERLIKAQKPYVIFESGLGASEYYGTKPSELFEYITSLGLKITLLDRFIKNRPPLSKAEFIDLYNNRKEYYFIAIP